MQVIREAINNVEKAKGLSFAIQMSIARGENLEQIKGIIPHLNADILNARFEKEGGSTILHILAISYHPGFVMEIIRQGGDTRIIDNHNETPIDVAIRRGGREMLRDLLQNNVQITPAQMEKFKSDDIKEVFEKEEREEGNNITPTYRELAEMMERAVVRALGGGAVARLVAEPRRDQGPDLP